jgi:ribonucleotide monophosphatase NagD (HAD superfamily)
MIGDRLSTDIEGAQRVGLRTALVLSGVTTREELGTSPIKPDGVFEDLLGLIGAFAG